MSEIVITKENFEEEVVKSDRTVLLDFWADWCGPCKMLSPIISEIADEHPEIKVGKVDVDTETELAASFQVFSIPTVIVFKDGKITGTSVGYRPKKEIESIL